jgi:hypothetical protein
LFNDIFSAVDVMKHPEMYVKMMSVEQEYIREEVIMASFVNILRHDVYIIAFRVSVYIQRIEFSASRLQQTMN